MVAVKFSELELKEFAKATPDFEGFIQELRKNPNFELEVVETEGAEIKYHGDVESFEVADK